MKAQCDLAKSKKCKKKDCPCFKKHTFKEGEDGCAGGCNDYPEQICVKDEKEKMYCKDCKCEITGNKNKEYCTECSYKRRRERAREKQIIKKYSGTKIIDLVNDKEKWKDKYRQSEEEKIILKAKLEQIERKYRINGYKNPAWYKINFNEIIS